MPDRVGGSPLSLKQPKFPGTVGRREERGKKRLVTHNNLDALCITCSLLAVHVQMS